MRVVNVVVVLLLTCGLGRNAAASEPVAVGSPAPALEVGRWIKGPELAAFEPGKIYVMEFWSTWCKPCIQSMPHLSELARRYRGQVSFVGVNVWENVRRHPATPEQIVERVQKMVSQMGEKMDYAVATDTLDEKMLRNWIRAAGLNGIPQAFIIKDGRIAWIGDPDDLDDPLARVVAG